MCASECAAMPAAASAETEPRPHIPGDPGIWVLISGDLAIFSLFFVVFLYYRGLNIELFAASQARLNQAFGALNTLLMLSSSWFVALSVRGARQSMRRMTALGFGLAFLCGVAFAIVKIFEYGEKLRAGITPSTNDFFMYYYVFTGIHLGHVLIGMGVLAGLGLYSRGGGFDARMVRNLETGASFWHLVDLLWIVLFALLYLLR